MGARSFGEPVAVSATSLRGELKVEGSRLPDGVVEDEVGEHVLEEEPALADVIETVNMHLHSTWPQR